MISLSNTLKKLFTIPRSTGKHRPRIFIDSASFDPKINREASCTAILTACNEAEGIFNRVRLAQGQYSSVIVIDQGSTDGTPFFAAEAGAVVILVEPNRSFAQAVSEATRQAHRSASTVIFID
jgi:hypothetical protein